MFEKAKRLQDNREKITKDLIVKYARIKEYFNIPDQYSLQRFSRLSFKEAEQVVNKLNFPMYNGGKRGKQVIKEGIPFEFKLHNVSELDDDELTNALKLASGKNGKISPNLLSPYFIKKGMLSNASSFIKRFKSVIIKIKIFCWTLIRGKKN